MIHVSLIAGKALVFDLGDVRRLRELGVGGVLGGTLPLAPQQNIFLGLPLQLMVEELIWLIELDVVEITPGKDLVDEWLSLLVEDDVKYLQHLKYQEFEAKKDAKLKQKAELSKNRKGSNNPVNSNDLSIIQSLSIDIANTPLDLTNYTVLKSIFTKNVKLRQKLLSSLDYEQLNYEVFKYLKKLNYFLAPGLRFGSKFIGYPGDPLRYHAHLAVNAVGWNQDIGVMNIVSGGRLATGVKKIWLIGSKPDEEESSTNDNDINEVDDDIICFSVEWAGFG